MKLIDKTAKIRRKTPDGEIRQKDCNTRKPSCNGVCMDFPTMLWGRGESLFWRFWAVCCCPRLHLVKPRTEPIFHEFGDNQTRFIDDKHSDLGRGTKQVKTGQTNLDHLTGHSRGHFCGRLRGRFRGSFHWELEGLRTGRAPRGSCRGRSRGPTRCLQSGPFKHRQARQTHSKIIFRFSSVPF